MNDPAEKPGGRMFDPYHQWLAIPRDQRPPTYYQLLGVAPDEGDAEVIAEAALRQTSHVRTYQAGPHAQRCIELLNEIARAKTTLLDPAKRKEYDATLTRKPATPAPETPDEESPVGPDPWVIGWVVLYGLLLLLGAVLAFWLSVSRPDHPRPTPDTGPSEPAVTTEPGSP